MAKSKRPSAKTGDTIDGDTIDGDAIDGDAIDGDAIEKPVDQTAPPHASASKHSQTAPPPSGLSSGPSSNAGSLITFAALALSVFAIGLASFAIWQQRQNTADIAALMPASNSDTMESANITNLEPNNSGPSSSEESSSDLADRLTALESQLAADRQSQQSALAGLQDQMATPAPPAADNSQNNDFGSDAKADIAAIRNDMDQRFAALEAALANKALPAKAGEDASDNADSQPAAGTQPASTSPQMTAPTGLLVVSGLLADNLAGQPLERWLSLLQGLADRGANITGLAPLQNAANPMPDSPHQLLQKAYDLVPQMTAALNHAADNAGFLEKTGAKLGQLVQLRAIGDGAGGNAAALGDFETALALKDLGSAINAAGQWSGSDLPSLDAWLAAAKARQTLDKAVNGLVTDYLATAIDVQ
ncbi:MAG: hypothetical protein L7W41_01980 [Alphaproteobacteria bacterium]|nr:hypothetical protein [Alphaproteobacteria bacterium]